ncbi:MAG: hypothetical protein U1F43_06360 [Myxococcota bacterium]
MNRSIAFAYAITGLAVAAALTAVIGSTTRLFGGGSPPATAVATAASPAPTSPALEPIAPSEPAITIIDPPVAGSAERRRDDDRDDRGDRDRDNRDRDDHGRGEREHDDD